MTPTVDQSIDELLRRHGLAGRPERPFPNDGWSGATMTALTRGRDRFVLKRDSVDRDWIARATRDGPVLREAWFAAHGPALPWPVRNPALGAGFDPASGESAVLMSDLSAILFDWNTTLTVEQLRSVLEALSALHVHRWRDDELRRGNEAWTPWRERVTLICRPTLERAGPAHDAVADRLLPGWDAWDRLATPAARSIIADLAADPQPLLDALAAERRTLIHGDVKLANVGLAADGAVEVVDWQMVMVAPVAIELGWFVVANVNALPLSAEATLRLYAEVRERAGAAQPDDGEADADEIVTSWQRTYALAILVGLLLRGWRKGIDAEAGIVLGSSMPAADDLRWWCEQAVDAAGWIP